MSSVASSSVEYSSQTSGKNAEKVHAVIGVIFITLLMGVLGVVYIMNQQLPFALSAGHEETHPASFITERAQNSLKAITDLGARITGGYTNEFLTVDLLKKEIQAISKLTNKKKVIDVDVQRANGAFEWFGIGNNYINAYANIQNVVVKLHGKNATYSILVNAHFDSKPIGAGGSDDGINCANMLEILRKLATSDEDYEHNIIFLFNGSEEQGLQGSHAFITQHKWAKNIKIVVNLDAAGAGGKQMILRTGPKASWLMKYYSVPYPNGQVLGEEIFGSGIVPSDTDFSIFTKFGGLVGFDLAYYNDGYRYHTSYDGFTNVQEGSYQHGGQNTLTLIRNLANAPELYVNASKLSTDNLVYYDYFGFFMVSYSESVGMIMNIFTVLLFLGICIKGFYDLRIEFSERCVKYVLLTLGSILLGWIFALAFVILIALLFDISKHSLSWFSNMWLILGLYCIPVFAFICLSILLLNRITKEVDLSVSASTLIQVHMVTLIWSIILLFGTMMRIRSICCVQLMVLFHTIAYIIIIVARLQHRPKRWPAVYIICTVFPNLCLMIQGLVTIGFFVPVTGRIGAATNTEILIGIIALLFTLLVTSAYAPLITLIRKPEIVLGVLASLFVLFFIVALTPVGFPYRGPSRGSPTPQRYWMHHTSRILHNEKNKTYIDDAGFYLSNMDRNAPLYAAKYVDEFENVTSLAEDCKKAMFCGLPLGKLRSFGATWIPSKKPIIDKPVTLKLESKKTVTDLITRFKFVASGNDHMEIYISPMPSASLISINLIKEQPKEIQKWNERPVYIIQYTCGKEAVPLHFSVDINVTTAVEGPLMDIALIGRYLHIDTNIKTDEYQQFINQFPEWSDVVPWLAVYESWVY